MERERIRGPSDGLPFLSLLAIVCCSIISVKQQPTEVLNFVTTMMSLALNSSFLLITITHRTSQESRVFKAIYMCMNHLYVNAEKSFRHLIAARAKSRSIISPPVEYLRVDRITLAVHFLPFLLH